MMLRSSLTASDLSDAQGAFSLRAYADKHGIKLSYPVPIDTFIAYGKWFQANAVNDLDSRRVTRVEPLDGIFRLRLADGDTLTAGRVIVAMGLANQEFKPAVFAPFGKALVSHACDHADLSTFRGKRVAVIGRGQSGCESAAILNDAGAEVELVSRGSLNWLGSESADNDQNKDLMWYAHQVMKSKSAVGPFPLNQLAEFPDIVRMLPRNLRHAFTERCLRPGSTRWVQPRFEGVKVHAGRTIAGVKASGSGVSIQFDQGGTEVDHVLLATGYRIDCAKLGLFGPDLLGRIARDDGSPVLTAGFQSSVPGLHFVGASAVKSYGPLQRFVAGAGYSARHLTGFVLADGRRSYQVGDRGARPAPVSKQSQTASAA
jgi:cation diffusion facilitator CzcD-associated flavoprotein CzcO